MKKTLHVEGMMCGHCEARVKKALEAIVTLTAEVSNETLKKAVEDQDYQVTGIE